ncbi:phosphate ABC transporter permease PstA [Novosphingobium sp. Fuku2-ISO-50]|uniref:phosphate ABC transporter permease PstA n=1 Tax=Novosphingobium sp. Fuku2-ISO-50 TaxID=1739114 RepID=UPI00076D9A74|nr:phosphate ABC transporter permease PstA [Novosphingobium sp. Fuku2-ISO-50]KUR75150.1 phosphate ABC transporter permease [Novosphingobium sp. Fuku2-ISO-50]
MTASKPTNANFDRFLHARRKLYNYIFLGLTGLATAIALAALALILETLVVKGVAGLDIHVFTMSQPAPDMAGGLLNAIVGSLIMCAIGMVIALFVGILAGTWLAEYGDGTKLATIVRFLNDILISAPSILIGLFVYELLVRPFHGFSAAAGGVALALLAMPVATRATEDIMRMQPNALREAGMALGANRGHVIRSIIWRASKSGLMTGALLSFARISGETAPLLFTSLGNPFLSTKLTQPMASMPTTIFQFAMSAYDDWQRLAWAGALLIAVAVLTTNIIGRALTRGSTHK